MTVDMWMVIEKGSAADCSIVQMDGGVLIAPATRRVIDESAASMPSADFIESTAASP